MCFGFPFFHQVVKTNQFSVTRHEKVANGLIGDQGLPGVFVLYELSPMMVKFTEKHRQVVTVAFIIADRFSNTISFYIVTVPQCKKVIYKTQATFIGRIL